METEGVYIISTYLRHEIPEFSSRYLRTVQRLRAVIMSGT